MEAKKFLDDLRRRIEEGNMPEINLDWFMNLSDSSLLNIAFMEATFASPEEDWEDVEQFRKHRKTVRDLIFALARRLESKMKEIHENES